MANKGIKGITVEIGGNTVGLQKSLSDVNKKSSELSAELRQINKALEFDPTNTTLLAQKQQLLSEQVKNTSDKLQRLKSVQEQVEQQYKNGDIGGEAYRAFQRELIKTEDQLKSYEAEQRKEYQTAQTAADTTENLSEEEKKLADQTDKVKDSSESFSKSLEGIKTAGETAASAVGTVTGAVGAVIEKTVGGTIEAGKAASGVGMSFESAVSQIAATMGKSVGDDEIKGLAEKAKELGATTQFSASQAAEGFNILAMAGLDAEQQTAAIGDVLNLAAAGSLSLSQAASYTAGAVKGFKDEMDNADYYTNLMAKGATLANTDVNNLGAALSGAAATANSYGQSADGVTLALLRLAQQGITGSEAATSMNRAMADLYTPSDAAKNALSELGVAVYDSNGEARDFNTIVDELNGKLSVMSDEQANALKNTIFTTNGLNAFNKMTASSSEEVQSFKDGLANASGSAQEQAETMINNLQGDITIMQSAAEGLGIAFYDTFDTDLRDCVKLATGYLSDLTEAFTAVGIEGAAEKLGEILVDGFTNISDYVPQIISAGTTLYDSLAASLTANAPQLAETAGEIVKSLASGFTYSSETILTAFTDLGKIILAEIPDLITPLMSSAGSFSRSIVGFFSRSVEIVSSSLPDILSELSSALVSELPVLTASVFGLITQTATAVLELLPEILPGLITTIGELVTAFLPQLITTIVTLAQAIVDNLPVIINVLLTALPTLIDTLLVALLAQLPTILSGVSTLISSLIGALPEIIDTIVTVVPEIIRALVTEFSVFYPRIYRAGLELFTSLTKDLNKIISAITYRIPEIIEAIIDTFIFAIPLLIECGVELFLALIENLPEIISGICEAVPRIIAGISYAIEKLHGKLVESGSKALLQLIEDLPTVITEIKKKMGDIIQGISDAIYAKYGDIIDVGYNLISGIWEGIQNAKDWLIEKISDWCSDVTDSIKEFFGIHSPSTLFENEIGENMGLGIGVGFEKSMKTVSKDMQNAIPTSFDISPELAVDTSALLVSGDRRMMTANPGVPDIPTMIGNIRTAADQTVIYLNVQIDRFDNSSGMALDEITDRVMERAHSYVQRHMMGR